MLIHQSPPVFQHHYYYELEINHWSLIFQFLQFHQFWLNEQGKLLTLEEQSSALVLQFSSPKVLARYFLDYNVIRDKFNKLCPSSVSQHLDCLSF